MTDTTTPAELAGYSPHWGASEVNYDAPWEIRADGLRCNADRMRTAAYLAAWQQMRATMPREQWSTATCDAIAESVLRTVRDWVEAP